MRHRLNNKGQYDVSGVGGLAAGVALGTALGIALVGPAFAGHEGLKPADYPTRPITAIVCYGKGGGADQAMTALMPPAEKILGVRINKINKPGGGGLNCLPDFAQTPPDGYTLLHHVDALGGRYVGGRIDINPAEDLEPLIVSNIAPNAIYVNPKDERFHDKNGKPSWEKVVEYAKANPGVKMANVNIPMELVNVARIEKSFGIKFTQVMIDRAAERYAQVIGGRIPMLWEQPGDVMAYFKAGKLAPVLSIWPERYGIYPDTPATGSDYGLEWTVLNRWRGVFVKKETPKPIVKYLAAVFKHAYFSDHHKAFIKRKSLDIVPSYRSPEGARELFKEEIKLYTKAFKALGWEIRPELR